MSVSLLVACFCSIVFVFDVDFAFDFAFVVDVLSDVEFGLDTAFEF